MSGRDWIEELIQESMCATELQKAGPMRLLKALLLASQGVEPVEANAGFVAEVDAVAGDAFGLLCCRQ